MRPPDRAQWLVLQVLELRQQLGLQLNDHSFVLSKGPLFLSEERPFRICRSPTNRLWKKVGSIP